MEYIWYIPFPIYINCDFTKQSIPFVLMGEISGVCDEYAIQNWPIDVGMECVCV